jgi:hypothetical protein
MNEFKRRNICILISKILNFHYNEFPELLFLESNPFRIEDNLMILNIKQKLFIFQLITPLNSFLSRNSSMGMNQK